MTYTAYNPALPDAATQNGTAFANSTRANMQAMRDHIALLGGMPGFNFAVSGGTAEQPAKLYYKRGTESIRVDLTWGISGGGTGNVTKAAYYYASNETHASFPTSTNGTYEGIIDGSGFYVQTLTYDASANLTSTTWGSTP